MAQHTKYSFSATAQAAQHNTINTYLLNIISLFVQMIYIYIYIVLSVHIATAQHNKYSFTYLLNITIRSNDI